MNKYEKLKILRNQYRESKWELSKLEDNWNKLLKQKIPNEQKLEIVRIQLEKYAEVNQKNEQALKNYITYINNSFHRDDIEEAYKIGGHNIKLTSFLDVLQKLDQKRA